MGEESSDTINLASVPEEGSRSISSEAVIVDDWIDNPFDRTRTALMRRWQRWQQVQISPVYQNVSVESDQSVGNLGNINALQAGEGSVAADERINDVLQMCENDNGFLEDRVSEKKYDAEESSGNGGSFLDCNVCLDLARDPVVTCCGHLFCWSCLYRWLEVHSDAKECPVCKGGVTIDTVTPIYGRGNLTQGMEDDSGLNIPPRPHARRAEQTYREIEDIQERITQLEQRFDERLEQLEEQLEKLCQAVRSALPAAALGSVGG